ncbi:hypothetical protein ACJRO7_000925 [Eucalyptus globulus]|uniref:Uncharacterized protein n=1 Tax=Eucalyptus globulus TaxID=34317 RepID=A0ABD3LPA6_EUCGL
MASELRASSHSDGKRTVAPYIKAISGLLGGTVEACCLQLTDVIKTRLQLDKSGPHKGIAHCSATVAKTEGVRALWKGLTPFTTHLTLKYPLRMWSNAMFESKFKDPETGNVTNKARFLFGFGAGAFKALVIVTPLEVVKIRLQRQEGLSPELLKYKDPIHCARTIICEEGLHGLWAGAAPTVMRNRSNRALMFTAKNASDELLWKKHESDYNSMISGFFKTNYRPMAQSRHGGVLKYKAMIHVFQTISREGLLASWKGLLPRLMRIPPGQTIMCAVADQVTGLCNGRFLETATV